MCYTYLVDKLGRSDFFSCEIYARLTGEFRDRVFILQNSNEWTKNFISSNSSITFIFQRIFYEIQFKECTYDKFHNIVAVLSG
jgi:hypothetical protein